MTRDLVQPTEDHPARHVEGRVDLTGLLRDARAGDPAALSRLIHDVTPILWQVVRQSGLDTAACEDVIQTAWLRLFRSPDTVRDPDATIGWLVTVVRREAWRVAARRRREMPADDLILDRLPAVGPDPEQTMIVDERHRALWDAVNRLSPRCRELIRIVAYTHRPTNASVAGALGMPVGSVGPTRGRCLDKLRGLVTSDPRWSA